MDDYIKREDAIEAIEDTDWYHINSQAEMVHGANSELHQAWYKAIDIYSAIDSVPSADVAPVRHGRWIEGKLPFYRWGGEKIGEKSTWKCSVCHDVGFWGYNYCPYCGAKMDGDAND